MSAIDLSHNSAPLRGAMRPSLEEVNALLRQDPLILWDAPKATSAPMADRRFLKVKLSLLCSVLVMGAGGFLLFSKGLGGPAQRIAGVAAQNAVPGPANAVPLSSVKHSLYLVLHKPSAEFISYLSELSAKGVTIRMVTTLSVPGATGVTVSTVKPEQISSDGVLIDGTAWYAIGPDSRFK